MRQLVLLLAAVLVLGCDDGDSNNTQTDTAVTDTGSGQDTTTVADTTVQDTGVTPDSTIVLDTLPDSGQPDTSFEEEYGRAVVAGDAVEFQKISASPVTGLKSCPGILGSQCFGAPVADDQHAACLRLFHLDQDLSPCDRAATSLSIRMPLPLAAHRYK